MPHPQTLLQKLENVLTVTEGLISEIVSGARPGETATRAWLLSMWAIGLIPHPDTFDIVDENGEVDLNVLETNIIVALTAVIEAESQHTRDNLITQFNATLFFMELFRDDILDSITRLESFISLEIISQAQNIINTLSSKIDSIGGVNNAIIETIQQLFINQSNRIEAFRDIQTVELVGSIASSQDIILSEIRALEIPIADSGDITLDIDLSEFITLFQDLLIGINEIRQAIDEQDINITIPDSSISLPDDLFAGIDILGTLGVLFGDNLSLLGSLNEFFTQSVQSELGGVSQRFEKMKTLVNKLYSNEITDYDEFLSDFNAIAGSGDVASFFLNAVLLFPVVVGGIISASKPFINNVETLARTKALDGLLPPDTIAELFIRRMIGIDDAEEKFAKIGFDVSDTTDFIRTRKIQLPDVFVREAFLRGILDIDEHDTALDELGYLQKDLELIREIYFRIPPVPDLIRFAVREAYDEDLVKALQLDSGFETIQERFEEDLKEQGLKPEFARLYWRSHWDLPSPTQGYEMLHRGIIDLDELEQLLKVSDFSPQWVDKLVSIAFTPFTRVDIRRMHKVGVLSDSEVFTAYQDIGYNEEKATKLQEFTLALNDETSKEKTKDLSQASILKAFKVGLLDRSTATTMLEQQGFNNREATILIDMTELGVTVDQRVDVIADNRRRIRNTVSKSFIEGTLSEQASRFHFASVGYLPNEIDLEIQTLRSERNILLQQERISNTMKQYIEFRIDENGVRSVLAREGYTPIEENDLFALWNTQRNNRFSNPTKAELKRWFVAGHTTFDETANYLRGNGYDNKLVDLYMQDMLDEREDSLVKVT